MNDSFEFQLTKPVWMRVLAQGGAQQWLPDLPEVILIFDYKIGVIFHQGIRNRRQSSRSRHLPEP